MNSEFETMLSGGHPNSLGRTEDVVGLILKDQSRLDELYQCYFSQDDVVRLRVSSAFKRITQAQPDWTMAYMDRLQSEIAAIDQASTQWTLAILFDLTKDLLSKPQKKRAKSGKKVAKKKPAAKKPAARKTATAKKTTTRKPAAKAASGLHVLIAEDNEINALLTRTLLEHTGHEVRLARNGGEIARGAVERLAVIADRLALQILLQPDLCQGTGKDPSARLDALLATETQQRGLQFRGEPLGPVQCRHRLLRCLDQHPGFRRDHR